MRRLKNVFWSWAVAPIGIVMTGFHATLLTFLGRRDPAAPSVERVYRNWARSWLRLIGVDLQVEGGEDLDATTSYVVVANHLSNVDIMICIAAVPVPIRFLAKKELFKYPVLSQAMRSIGIVEVDRAAHARAVESINRQAELVRSRNHSLMVYAEGTRSRDGELKPFKKGAFAIASGAGMPIVPVAISGTREVMPPGSLTVDRHRTVRVTIGEPITETEGIPITALRDETHTRVLAMLQRMAGDD